MTKPARCTSCNSILECANCYSQPEAQETPTLSHRQLADRNMAQVVLWLAQAAEITLIRDRTTEADAIHKKMMDILHEGGKYDRV